MELMVRLHMKHDESFTFENCENGFRDSLVSLP